MRTLPAIVHFCFRYEFGQDDSAIVERLGEIGWERPWLLGLVVPEAPAIRIPEIHASLRAAWDDLLLRGLYSRDLYARGL